MSGKSTMNIVSHTKYGGYCARVLCKKIDVKLHKSARMSGMWLGVDLRTDTKKARVKKGLYHVLKIS